ncbi:glycosyltransferase family 4 protein [Lewinella sp. JB7]|uniref:glycosyltransferase family 4 protein n=1 Tax=Lewinella sp. JB7 TaxID=2962887 RepID=UPI0020C98B24|nr:glycosyltransferase family 4 protein [Lewinella sp. JB7]MCP9234507.1 glycosyltransferase family 4 protein [Lewinella sp. JB7]
MITFSHPTGNANVRAALTGLNKAGLLGHFHTAIAAYPGNTFASLSAIGPLADFGRRTFPAELEDKTHLYPWMELGRQLAAKTGISSLTRHETGLLSVDAVYQGIDRRVAGRLTRERPRAVYAYEDGAATTFEEARELDILNLYDLPIGYWRAARRLLGEVVEQRPDWAMTIKGMQDSPTKLARKDRELELADHIFVASSFTAQTLADYPGKLAPVHVIPYGFPPPVRDRTYLPATGRKLRLLFVGGLSQRKGLAEMFEAVRPFGDRVALTVVGRLPGEDCPALNEALAHHKHISSLPHAEILSLMREHDVLVFPSHFEGFGLVITEAMSQGTPVITTERTAGPDLIEHDRDGFLVPAGSTDALATQIEELLARPDKIEQAGRAASARAARRPWSVYGSELAAAIDKILS